MLKDNIYTRNFEIDCGTDQMQRRTIRGAVFNQINYGIYHKINDGDMISKNVVAVAFQSKNSG